MKKFKKVENLEEVLELHSKWLAGADGGVRANLIDADLSKADLNGVNLSEADLKGANLSGADLRDADLKWTDLRRAYLNGANLRGAYLKVAKLGWASLRRADLRRANLIDANLRNADLTESYLHGAVLTGADIRWTLGNGKEVRTFQTGVYHVCIYNEVMAIGCQQYTISEWLNISDDCLCSIDGKTAIDFKKKWGRVLKKVALEQLIESKEV